MPNSSTTIAVDTSQTTNAAAALAYGYVWATGKRAAYYELQNTGDNNADFTRVGFWILGEGQWDGCQELWINDGLVWKSEVADPNQFHFHSGTDSIIGAGLLPTSTGTDQLCDQFWGYFPSAITPLNFSRMAYYGIFRKQPIENQTNTHQYDPTQWTDIAPVGLWRGLRVRIFDDEGNQTGYGFSTNPVWQWVDLKLRRQVFPEYNISLSSGIDAISAAAQARFNWGDIYASAQYCNQLIPTAFGPRPRFSSSCAFSQQTTLAAIEEQILKICRGYTRSYGGKMSLLIDQPRSSVFTFSRSHVMPGSFSPSDKTVSQQPNSYQAKFRDLMVPAIASIASITSASPGAAPVVTTDEPNCANAGDEIAIGGTGTNYDGTWSVASVPTGDVSYTLTLVSKGSNYPASVGAGGVMGLLYSRFKERAPVFNHETNQYARGAAGVGLPRQMNAIPVSYDFAVCTFDQASRVARYEKDRALGLDVTPYVTPPALTFRSPAYALDAAGSGAVAKQIQPGDRVTLDNTASWAYAGDYEVIQRIDHPLTGKPVGSENSITMTAAENGGEIEWKLGPYNEVVFYDYTDPSTAGWSNVPGSDPGNNGNYTPIDIADGGQLAFMTGAVASGTTFQLPATGFTPSNVIAWASPQGYLERAEDMAAIGLCKADPATLVCTLNYEDNSSDVWGGDLNVAAVSWIGNSTAASTTVIPAPGSAYSMQCLLLTLSGGELACIGWAAVPDGTQLALPSGFSWSKAFALASPYEGNPTDRNADGFGAYVDAGGVVHIKFSNESASWGATAQVFVFAWQNNSGTVTTQTTGGANWMLYTTATGYTLGVGLGTFANGATLGLPSAAGAADSLQLFPTIHSFTDTGVAAHGVGACYVDSSLVVHAYFSNGSAVWNAEADVLAVFYEPASGSGTSAGGITVTVTPAGISMAPSGTQQFSATVTGSTDTDVNWFVNGIAGGNSDVGTIDDTGLYTAPAVNGTYLISAVSQANDAAEGYQFVQVGTGGQPGGSGSTDTFVVTPHNANTQPYGEVQFTVTVTGITDNSATWYVNGILGGNAEVGTVSTGGLYTAPAAQGTYSVTAKSSVVDNLSGTSVVVVGNGGIP